jgi:hypothetical protein
MKGMISVDHKGSQCYIIDAILVADGKKTMRIKFKDRIYFMPKCNAEFISPRRLAIKVEQFDILFDQQRFKKTVMTMAILRSAKRRSKQN